VPAILGDDMSELAAWDSFYVIVGSAAGALNCSSSW
jgi:hypothetical protein